MYSHDKKFQKIENMANEIGSLVQEFEASFQKCLNSLTEEDDLHSRDPEGGGRDIDEKMSQFTDAARSAFN